MLKHARNLLLRKIKVNMIFSRLYVFCVVQAFFPLREIPAKISVCNKKFIFCVVTWRRPFISVPYHATIKVSFASDWLSVNSKAIFVFFFVVKNVSFRLRKTGWSHWSFSCKQIVFGRYRSEKSQFEHWRFVRVIEPLFSNKKNHWFGIVLPLVDGVAPLIWQGFHCLTLLYHWLEILNRWWPCHTNGWRY